MNAEFDEKEYRAAFVAENLRTGIAFQIRALRNKERWSQAQLGEKAGKAQNVISRLEDPDYGKFTVNTLIDIASAFDVGLSVRFVAFSDLIEQTNDLSPEALAVSSYEEEARLRRLNLKSAVATAWYSYVSPANRAPAAESYFSKEDLTGAKSGLLVRGQRTAERRLEAA